jgi:hypothetical protein
MRMLQYRIVEQGLLCGFSQTLLRGAATEKKAKDNNYRTK